MLREEAAGGAGAGESAGAVDLGGRVVIASYLLAPGYFHDQLAKAGADLVTAPLLPSPVLADIALERYDAALAGAAAPTRRRLTRPRRTCTGAAATSRPSGGS